MISSAKIRKRGMKKEVRQFNYVTWSVSKNLKTEHRNKKYNLLNFLDIPCQFLGNAIK
jgi:hypothetical protein